MCLTRLVGLLVGEELLAARGIVVLRRLWSSCCNRPLLELLLLFHVDLGNLLQDCLLHARVHVFKPLVGVEVDCARQTRAVLRCLQMNVRIVEQGRLINELWSSGFFLLCLRIYFYFAALVIKGVHNF